MYQRIRAESDPNFRDIGFVNVRSAVNGRVAGVPNKTDPIRFSDSSLPVAPVPECVVQAKYRIDLALPRPHNIAGVTLITKNNFGSILRTARRPPLVPGRARALEQFQQKKYSRNLGTGEGIELVAV